MELTKYEFEFAIGGFFEMATSDARRILPAHLQPLEVQHTRSILAVTAFEFTGSMVGAYNEVVLSIIVPPIVKPGQPLPKAAYFPFMVGTDTEASRLHAIERWHLPHYMKDLSIDFTRDDGRIDLEVSDDGAPILAMTITDYAFEPANNLYNSFMVDGENRYKANIYMNAPHSDHEEEQGHLTLHPHAMTEMLTLDEVDTLAFREQWYQAGVQTFEPLESI